MNPKFSLAAGILCISFSPIFVKMAGVPALTAGFYRLSIAWVCLAPVVLFKKQLAIGRRELLLSLAGGIVFASDIAAWNISLLQTSATVSTLLANLAPLWVGLLGFLLFKRRAGGWFWAGVSLAVTGMAVLVGWHHIIGLKFSAGILLALLASFFYANYILITGQIMQKISTLTFMFYNMLSAGLFLFIVCSLMHSNLGIPSLQSGLCLLGTGTVCQLGGWITINYALRYIAPPKVSVSLLGQVVMAGLLASILLGERLGTQEMIGSAIMLLGIASTFFGKILPLRRKVV